ncbi:hypothetical protein FPOAC1_012837 [Fusarium poae]|nr:hypothetical protein FPOAC1_014106 [Fusarium poae]KAG8667994.1 hypothetical protein FPOAC1_012837 [Fusarium poae]
MLCWRVQGRQLRLGRFESCQRSGRLQGRQVWPGRFEGYEPAGTAARAATGCPASGEFIWPVAEAVWETVQEIFTPFAKDVFINQERKLGDRRRSDTVVVLTINYAD